MASCPAPLARTQLVPTPCASTPRTASARNPPRLHTHDYYRSTCVYLWGRIGCHIEHPEPRPDHCATPNRLRYSDHNRRCSDGEPDSNPSSGATFGTAQFASAPVTSVTIPSGQSTATFWYGLTTPGDPTITASAPNYVSGTQRETITPAPAGLGTRRS